MIQKGKGPSTNDNLMFSKMYQSVFFRRILTLFMIWNYKKTVKIQWIQAKVSMWS